MVNDIELLTNIKPINSEIENIQAPEESEILTISEENTQNTTNQTVKRGTRSIRLTDRYSDYYVLSTYNEVVNGPEPQIFGDKIEHETRITRK